MTSDSRRMGRFAAAAMALVLIFFGVQAQVPLNPGMPPKKAAEEPKSNEGVTLPIDRESRRLIQAAQDYVKKKEWKVAAEALQTLLDAKEDTFFEIEANDGGKVSRRRVSVRKEANRLLGELPAEGLEFYQVQYGQVAEAKLQEALEKHDAAALADVSQRYLHTKAGSDATSLLATYHLDQGNYLMAALCYERLLSRADGEKLSPKMLFKAALAYRRANDPETSEKIWKRFVDKAGSTPLAFGAKKLSIDQLRKELERPTPLVVMAGFGDWPIYRGTPMRTAQGVGGTAFLEPRWRSPMRVDETSPSVSKEDADASLWVQRKLEDAFNNLKDKPKLPSFFPVAANGKLIYRTYDGVYSVYLKDGDTPDGKVQAGEIAWVSATTGSLHGLARVLGRRSEIDKWLTEYSDSKGGLSGVLFENSVVGTLSHDNQRVYFVDDLAVPPSPARTNFNGFAVQGPMANYGELDPMVKANKLCAVELDTGKVLWTLGDPETGVADDPGAGREAKDSIPSAAHLLNTYFLGPPLPLGGRLYVLVEKLGEFRLLCLDPNKPDAKGFPELVWQQSLGMPNVRLNQDIPRRLQAVHLAYADGIIVVPTNSGVILGVDLLSHSLVWSYSYLDAPPPTEDTGLPGNPRVIRGRVVINQNVQLNLDRWRTSAPAIANGKVVFTAHDANNLHCLNLRDGQPLWKVKREDDDLFMAGVFSSKAVVVGKRHVKAINLDQGARETWGKPQWRVETGGAPSGQGAASDDVYYLPLQSTGDSNQPGPGILAINMAAGKKVSVAARRNQELPGNLLFVEGEIISQTPLGVSSYPQEAVKRAEITRRLEKNPRDPMGLAERGELYLYVGQLSEAIKDLRSALDSQPTPEIRTRARGKLYDAYAELAQNDFAAADQYVDEFRGLCKPEIPADADASLKARLTDEFSRRQDNFLSLVGRGRDKQGRMLDSLAAYEELGTREDPSRLISVIDEPNTVTRRDVLARGRIKGLLERAAPEQKQQIEERLTDRFRAIPPADIAALRRFVGVTGTLTRAGREAQLALSERLLASNSSDDLTEAETRLQPLCYSREIRRDEPTTAARALEAMARLYIRRELYEDAVGLYKQIGTEFGNVQMRDGRTGADVLNDLYTDKRFLPYIEPAGLNWRGVFRGTEVPGVNSQREFSLTLEPEGASLPFFQRHRLVLDMAGTSSWKLSLLDRFTNERKCTWEGLAAATYFLNSNNRSLGLRFAFARGHILILQLANFVYAFDLAEANGKELWRYDLLGSRRYDSQTLKQINLDEEGNLWVMLSNNTRERVGQVAICDAEFVALQTDRGLVAVDPRKPGPVKLWQRADISTREHVFGDSEYLFAVETPGESGGTATTVRAFASSDGSPIKVPDFATLYATPRRVRIMGRQLLLNDDDAKGGKILRLYDIPSGKDLWRKQFAAGSIFVRCDEPGLAAMIEPDQTVTVMDARGGEVLFTTHLEPEHAEKLKEATLVADRDRLYLALQRSPENGLSWSSMVSQGIRTVRTHGALYALNRQTGKIEWICPDLDHQMLMLEQLKELPLLLFAAVYQKTSENGGLERNMAHVTAVDKRTGKLVFDNDLVMTTNFHALRTDPSKGSIELVRQDLKIAFKALSQNPAAKEAAKP